MSSNTTGGYANGEQPELGNVTNSASGGDVENDPRLICGPLLNYKWMDYSGSDAPKWHGSVLVVTNTRVREPYVKLRFVELLRGNKFDALNGNLQNDRQGIGIDDDRHLEHEAAGTKLYSDPSKAFWRFDLELKLQKLEARWEYSVYGVQDSSDPVSQPSLSRFFVVPSASQSMRIMFHSCNGFSVGTDEDAWSGPALWNDVMRLHAQKPFHVMIGGGDQIYNDGVRVDGPLRPWTDIRNPRKRRDYPFHEQMRDQCDLYYFKNYVRWFSTEPFATANAQIPQINIWDDHDIIDGFGSYTDRFMKCAVFRGIGGVSFKYYCLFQNHIPPPESNFVSPPRDYVNIPDDHIIDTHPAQPKDVFVLQDEKDEPCLIKGNLPGPYVEERSRSMYMRLGARIAFLGVDARTERTRHQVNYPDTYEMLFNRLRSELSANPGIKHLIVLLGVPIAYPRLAWLENIFTSPIIGPIRFLNKRFGIAGGFFNHFDGQVDLLDDLDDHYTARQHKRERKDLIISLQAIAQSFSVRVTILGGDVHLAAVGRFYSNPKLSIPTAEDHRYIANLISSAITNKPPPKAIANLLARRNKIHRLDHCTHETLMNLFDRDPGDSSKTAHFNHCTMPSRNYAIISEAEANFHLDGEAGTTNGHGPRNESVATTRHPGKDGHSPLHPGEDGAGTQHVVASGIGGGALPGGLDICIKVEIDQHDQEGRTQGYGFSIPALSTKTAQKAVVP